MKILFAGTPDFAVAPLQNIIDAGFEVVGVVTQIDKPQGRKAVMTAPPVKTFAQSKGIPVFQPEKIRDAVAEIRAFGADIMVTCAYGQILTQDVLDAFEMGVWNIHAGLLPFYRGASPIQSCILNGETETGVSVMKTELGLDSGDILLVEKTPILETETYGELSERLSFIGAELIVKALRLLESGAYTLQKQDEDGVCVVRKIHKETAEIRFDKSVQEIINLVRAMNPSPVAYTIVDGNKLNVYRAEKAELIGDETLAFEGAKLGEILTDKPKRGLLVKAKDGAVKLVEVQPAGGKRMSSGDLLNGRKVKKGQVLGC